MLHALGERPNTGQECYQSTSKPEEKVTSVNFSMIHSVHEPQGFAGKPLKQLKSYKETWSEDTALMNFISRLARITSLSVPLYTGFFLQQHQEEEPDPSVCITYFSVPGSPRDHWGAAQDHATHSVMTRTLGKSWQEEVMPWEVTVNDWNLPEDLAQYKIHSTSPRILIQFFWKLNPQISQKEPRVSLQRSQ